ncbi:MAG TPA: ATP-dependent DNA helicase RecG [Candidatus Eisenbacteria bacterium]|nr:ATP-dependent DNA helicase RecG [Candidatus Eisenbacteria bacterium]
MKFKETNLSKLNQISDKRSALFAKLNVHNLEDLLFFYPRTYEDWTDLTPLHLLTDGSLVTIKAKLIKEPKIQYRGRLSWLRSYLSDGVTVISVIWFNQPWLMKKLEMDKEYYFHGKIQNQGRGFSIQSPLFLEEREYKEQPIFAIYPLTSGLTQNIVRNAIDQSLKLYDNYLADPLPDKIRQEIQLCTLEYALEKIHQPLEKYEHEIARERLAFEELFLVRAALYLLKRKRQSETKSIVLISKNPVIKEKMNHLRESLPFQLTRSQITAINDMLNDLKKEQPMNRLLQGDVGSGKTMVAAFALAYTVWCGYQGMFMVPTSILAQQHYETLHSLLDPVGIKIELLTGQTTAKKRRELLEAAKDHSVDIIVGTHALLEKDLILKNLALTITDEQHRFGVAQRSSLFDKQKEDYTPHRLVMSATPIPRTLALILYGDLDLSLMTELPKGRKKIKTYTARSEDKTRIYKLMRQAVDRGEQVYVVNPLIEDSDEMDLESAESSYKYLSKSVFPDLNIGLIYGSLNTDQKNKVMQDFIDNKINILVSTTVIEVGVDNPRATFMLIQNAERFGLAQLHQLRGRIGRSNLDSICVLLSDSEDELAVRRMQTLCHTQDGFELAEEDLKLRGPGDFFGTKQHGLPQFKLINLYEDQAIIKLVDQVFDKIVKNDPYLSDKANQNIVKAIQQRYPELILGITL